MRKRDPYRAIMIAAARGRGVRLTDLEAWDLACDDAISTRANSTLTQSDIEKMVGRGWQGLSVFPPAKKDPTHD